MRKFEWRWVKRLEGGEPYPALLIVEDGKTALFVGIVMEDGDEYFPVVLNKERSHHLATKERMSLKDAKLAIEKYAVANGIIPEGVWLEDYMDDRKEDAK